MTTNQELRHASFRSIAGTSGTYNEDLYSMCLTVVSDQGGLNGTFLAFLQSHLSSSNANLPGLMHEFATAKGANSWDELGTFSLV